MPDLNDTIDDHALPRLDIRKSFSEEPRPLDLVLPGMIAGTVGALVAQGGAGKSWLALEIAFAVAGGPDILQLGVPATGPVLYLPAEDPSLAIEHRLFAARDAVSGSVDRLADNLEIIPRDGARGRYPGAGLGRSYRAHGDRQEACRDRHASAFPFGRRELRR